MKTKRVQKKYYIYVALFVVTAVITFIAMGGSQATAVTSTMTEASLPVVMVLTDDGTEYNAMYGYTGEVDSKLLNTSVTILSSSRRLKLAINTYGETVESVSYKIRDKSDKTLIEDTKLHGYGLQSGQIHVELNIKNLLSDNTEYLMEIVLTTQKHEKISYFTTIYYCNNVDIQSKLNFVTEFCKNTASKETLGNIAPYIETSKNADNSNFGKVNINCSQSQIGWGDMTTFIESNIVPSIISVGEDTALLAIDYTLGAENEAGGYDTYLVHEFYRIRQSRNNIYLLDFQREASQIFDGKNDATQSGRINLGVQPNQDINYLTSKDNDYVVFENNGSLWNYHVSDNTFTRIFTFESEDSDNLRERINNHGIKIINLTDNGDCYFMIYGYMNRGKREGQLGISLYSYRSESNEVDEMAFIPSSAPFAIMDNKVGDVAYVNDDNVFYLIMDDVLYSVELTGKEVMVEVTDLEKGSYAATTDGSKFAYNVGGSPDGAGSIRIMDLKKGEDHIISAGDGEKLKVIGFVNNDFIYGAAKESDIVKNEFNTVTFPMYSIAILDENYDILRTYQPEGIYVKEAVVSGLRVNLSRIAKDEGGNYYSVSMDQLINREDSVGDDIFVDTMSTSYKETEVVIKLATNFINTPGVSVRYSTSINYSDADDISIDRKISGEGMYYVYSYGRYRDSFLDVNDAILLASDTCGMVYDGEGRLIWTKY